MSQPTIGQRRAAAAWRAVKEVKDAGNFGREYYTLAASAPADIQTNGLGQTLAFWYAKSVKEPAHRSLFRHSSEWVLRQMDAQGCTNLLDWITQVDSDHYRRATAEALAFLSWVKRFAEAELSNG